MHFKQLLPDQYNLLQYDENIIRFPLINAILSCKQSGTIFAMDSSSFFIQHKAGFSLLMTDHLSEVKEEIIELFTAADIPTYFHLYNPPFWIVDLLIQRNDMFNIRIRNRIQLRSNTSSLSPRKSEKSRSMSDFTIEVIDETNFSKLFDLGLNIGDKFWDSKEHFLGNGFGVCLLSTTGKPIASCYSAALVNNVAEIDIKTSADNLNSGFGQIAANEFLRLASRSGVIANWDCFTDNLGSLKIAKNAGLEEIFRYQFVSVFNKNARS